MRKRFTFLTAALALLVGLAIPLGMRGQTYTQITELDMTTKAYGTSNYNANTAYTSNGLEWHIVNGANNNKQWNYFKMGGKSATISDYNPCYIYSPAISEQVDKVTVHLPSGSLSKNGMSVNSWGLYVYSNSQMTTQVDYVAGGTITNSAASFDFTPSTGVTWAANYYYKVSWDLANTTTTNGIVCVDKITLYKESGGTPTPSMSVSPASIDFGSNTISPSEPYTESFNVTFANLTQDLSVSVGSGLTGVSVSPTTILTTDSSPATVTVSYNPTAEGSLNGNITVSNTDDNLSETVAVTGSAYDPANVLYYEKVTAALSNWSGEYIFTGINSSNYYALSGVSSNLGTTAQVTVTENGIQSTSTIDGYKVTVAQTTNGYSLYMAGAGYLYYTGSSNSLYAAQTFTANTCEWNFSFANGVATISNVNNSARILQFNYNSGNPRFACYGNSGQTKITLFKYNDPNKVKTPTISPEGGEFIAAQSVTISSETSGASIYYTTDGSTPTTASTLFTTAFTVSTTTTVKAIAVKSGMTDSDVASVTYTFVTPFTTMQQVYENAEANTSEHEVYITFNNWVITGTNGSSASQFYLTDPDNAYGCVIYGSGSGFTTGNTLNGTVKCKLLYFSSGSSYSFAEIKELTTSTAGLTVGTGGSVTPITTTIDALTSEKTGTVVKLENLTYNGTVLTDNNNNIINNSNYIYSATLTSNKTYDITGVFAYAYAQNNTPKRICPRSAADIVLKAVLDIDASMTPFSYIVNNGPSAEQNIDIICANLGSNTLTATASSDYEVSLDYEGTYTQSVEMTPTSGEVAETVYVRLKAGLSVGEHNGTVTFTAANLTTVEVALEGAVSNTQTYGITLTQPNEATIAADKAVAEAGETVTLSYSDVDECYEFFIWSVLYEIDEEIFEITPDANNQFTMPAAEVYVYATFEQRTFTVNYSVNGTVEEDLVDAGIVCGEEAYMWDADELEGEGITLPTGYTFAGWSTAAGSAETVSSFIPTENATLYAVMVPENAFAYVKVTSLQDITAGEYFIVNDGYVLPNADATNAGPVKSDDYKITTPLSDSYETMPVAGTAWTFTGTNEAMTIKNSTTSHYLYVAGTSNNNQVRVSTTSNHTWSFAVNDTGFSMKDNTNSRYCATYESGSDWRSYNSASASNYGDGGVLYLYKKSTPSGYTLIKDIASAETLPNIEPAYLVTVKNGGVLTLTGTNNGDVANLIIEDGGQLICNNAVAATVKKTINGHTPTDKSGWNFIASPIRVTDYPYGISPADAGLITDTYGNNIPDGQTASYDLYKYEEHPDDGYEWRNYRNNSFNLEMGSGYLYANVNTITLNFTGTLRSCAQPAYEGLDITSSAGLPGWNLVGNPFPCNATIDRPYYILTNGILTAKASTIEITPCAGVMVQAAEIDIVNNTINYDSYTGTVKFTKAGTGSTPQPSQLQMTVVHQVMSRGEAQSQLQDNAIVSFNEGNYLEKFGFNAEASKLYIPQGGRNFAIVSAKAQGEMPVNFKASTDGEYTITVNPEGVEMNYLHLIDNMTGMDIDLLQTPSYTFDATTNDYESRFRLVFGANNVDGPSTGSGTFAYFNGSEWQVSNEGEATLQVIDMMGRIVSTETVNGNCNLNLNQNAGVYMLRLINSNGVKTQKVVVR
ncbi:MAG: chitobiase/beta-hexosaminidase C-terminal domain-containing protein [Bacteroidales bacterium]|nr:chitobiase/beta-hexosaminidase C-terminal domain-containing protein [Bacteroidales bacterium]